MNILVSGSSGFIASHLIPKLDKLGHKVYEMDIKNGNWYDVRSFDNCFAQIIDDIECVIHLAAYTDVQESVGWPVRYFYNNELGVVNMLNASKGAKVKRFIFASSAAADLPESPYGVTKLCGEHWCDVFNKCYGLSTISLRFFNVYGKGTEKGVIPLWIKSIKEGKQPVIYGGEQERDFIYVDDVCDAIISQIESDKVGVYEVGSGESVRIDVLCEMLIYMMKSKLKPIVKEEKTGEIFISEAGKNNIGVARPLEWGLREMIG